MTHDLNHIVENYGNLVTGISHRMIENRELAKEAAQEAWIEIIKSLHRLKGESQLSTYIFTIASRTI